MAEAVVSYVAGKLRDLLLSDAELSEGVRGQLRLLHGEMRRMRAFVKELAAELEINKIRRGLFSFPFRDEEDLSDLVSLIRDAAYDVESLIDSILLEVTYRKRKDFVKRCASIFKYWCDINNFGKQIETLLVRIQDIFEIYRIRIDVVGEGTSSREVRQSCHRGLENDTIGLEEDTTKLVAQLVKDDHRRSVISIVGMGGIGKTTLATKVYKHGDVMVHFDCRAWVCVSHDWRLRDIVRGILRQVSNTPTRELHLLQEKALEAMLYDALKVKRYLVVLDNIWTKEAWDILVKVFPNTSNGSKLMLTTRNKEVALYADDKSIPRELRMLSEEDSWELFCRKAFMDSTLYTSCPLYVKDVGKEIVARCYGLPLAIILIGGLLSRKKSFMEWQSVLDNLERKQLFIEWQNQLIFEWQKYNLISYYFNNGAFGILNLSYNELPNNLKYCFLYLAHFPEDYVISVRKLLQLWIAEGLISEEGEGEGERMESTAEDCLNELIHRNMVQAVRFSVNMRVKECRIHDLLREFSVSMAEEIFLQTNNYENRDFSLQQPKSTRHLAIHSNGSMYFKSPPSAPHLRSLLVFDPNPLIQIKIIYTSFQQLRVLELENCGTHELPRDIGKLINLRYLGLRKTYIHELPLSMKYLQSLQTLDIRGVGFSKIPNVISKLENLRHLHMSPLREGGQLKIDTLKHLRTVSQINVLNWKGNNSKRLRNIWKLKVVADESSKDDDLLEFFNSIAHLEKLSSLHLQTSRFHGVLPSLKESFSSLHHVTKLHLDRMWGLQPNLLEFPKNLFQLTLNHSPLNQDEMKVLGKLPKLSILRLRYCTVDRNQLIFSANGFPELNFLILDAFPELKEFSVEEGAMPKLKRLRISYCRHITSFPEGILSAALEVLEIEGMPQSFEDKLRGS